jgi:hypothetical protein
MRRRDLEDPMHFFLHGKARRVSLWDKKILRIFQDGFSQLVLPWDAQALGKSYFCSCFLIFICLSNKASYWFSC